MANQVKIQSGILRILDDSILEAYNESIQGYNEKARDSLGKFSKSDGELTGSSPLMLIQLANSGLLPEGTRLAKREDLENAISQDSDFLRGHYTDFGLALKTAGDSYAPNDLLAKRLAEQFKQRNIKLGEGKLIYFDSLYLIEDENSAYGLIPSLKDGAESSILDLDDFRWNYTRDEGLACADLVRDRYWDSNFEHVADSGGRRQGSRS
ncbi:MAG: hypothetical protein AABX83_00330 [Nanoarchaeota archaeon]